MVVVSYEPFGDLESMNIREFYRRYKPWLDAHRYSDDIDYGADRQSIYTIIGYLVEADLYLKFTRYIPLEDRDIVRAWDEDPIRAGWSNS